MRFGGSLEITFTVPLRKNSENFYPPQRSSVAKFLFSKITKNESNILFIRTVDDLEAAKDGDDDQEIELEDGDSSEDEEKVKPRKIHKKSHIIMCLQLVRIL